MIQPAARPFGKPLRTLTIFDQLECILEVLPCPGALGQELLGLESPDTAAPGEGEATSAVVEAVRRRDCACPNLNEIKFLAQLSRAI